MDEWITVREAAAMLPRGRGKSVHPRTVRRWIARKLFKAEDMNGLKVHRGSFLVWAIHTNRLKPGMIAAAIDPTHPGPATVVPPAGCSMLCPYARCPMKRFVQAT